MAQPPAYNRQYDFSDFSAGNPSGQQPGDQLDAELDAVKATADSVLTNLALIQRDDGTLANQTVHLDALSSDVRAILASTTSTVRGSWATSTEYAVADVVLEGGLTYLCFEAHTSDTFATDLAASKWGSLSSTAGSTAFTPAGNVASTNVQTAIQELDSEKEAAFTDVGAKTVQPANTSVSVSLALLHGAILDPRNVGVTLDGSTDDTVAMQAAIDHAITYSIPIRCPAGEIKVTAELDATAGALKMYGAGVNSTVINQHTDNIAILKVGVGGPHISDMQLRYNTAQAIGNTDANAIEFYGTNYGVFERLNLYRCNRGMYVPQTAVVEGSNYLFSCSIRDITVNYYSNNGMDLSGFNGGVSGNIISNVFLLGRDDSATALDTNEALKLSGWGNGVLSQINIEASNPTEGIYCDTCPGVVFEAIHFEGVKLRTNFGGYIHFSGGRHVINNLAITLGEVDVTNKVFAVRVSTGNEKVRVSGVEVTGNTITSGTAHMFGIGTETGVELYAEMVDGANLTDAGFSSSTPSAIKQYGEIRNGLKVVNVPLPNARQAGALKDALPDSPNSTTLGLGDALDSVITGTTTNNNSRSETCAFFIQVPDGFDNSSWPVLRLRSKVSVARAVSQTIDVVAKRIDSDGASGSDICNTDAQTLTTSYADYDFTIIGTTLAVGDLLHIQVTLATDDTGGGTNGLPTLAGVALRQTTFKIE